MIGSPIASMFVQTETGSLETIHRSRSNREGAKMLLIERDGTTVEYNNDLNHIRGRGNATWHYDKKPYNFNLSSRAPLLGMGNTRRWCLIANHIDPSHIRHLLAYRLAEEVGIPFAAQMTPVDLYINNEYQGLYYLSERKEIGDPLINITNLERATSAVNNGADLNTFPQRGTRSFSRGTLKYYDIPNDPEDITGGYLMEWELSGRYNGEPSGFVTSRGQAVVISSPQYASQRQVEYIREIVQDMEDAVYSPTGYNEKGKHYTEYICEESFAKMYVLQEFSMNLDAGITSFFIYKESDLVSDGKLRCAPPWDFDQAWGNHGTRDGVNLQNPELWWANRGRIYENRDWTPHILAALYQHTSFVHHSVRVWHTFFKEPADKMVNPDSKAETRVIEYIWDYANRIELSAAMNHRRWSRGRNLTTGVTAVVNFTSRRADFLTRQWVIDISDLDIERVDGEVIITDGAGFRLVEGIDFEVDGAVLRGIGFYTGSSGW
jgi:hypothetical protein